MTATALSSSLNRPHILTLGSLLALAAAVALLATQAHAQAPEPASAASAPAATPLKYSDRDLERAFNFMDKNQDGKITRDEASSFRGVSKHFDEADTNKDGVLSREEFDNAMNRSKQP